MTFLNLHFLPPLIPFTESLQINSDLDHPSHIILSNHSNENTCPFFFQFSEADQRLHDFYQKGICDFYGKITETYMSLPLCPSLNDPTIFKPVIKQIQEILALKRVILDSTLKINKNSSIQISISTSLEELFKHIDHLSSQNKLTESNLNSIFHVLEIYLIGSSVLPLIGKDALEAITIHYFGHLYTENQIKEWFTEMSHLQQFFSNTGNDLDTRILISNSRIESVSALCDVFLKFLYQKIPKLAFVHIQKFFPRDKNQNDILSSYLLSSKAIKNRVRVHDEYSTFALLALNTNSLPIDLNCVGSHFNQDTNEYKPTLEFPNLTSLNSLSIPLKQFLNSDLSAENFAFFSHPFGIQSLLDLLFNCATPTTYNHFGWRYFLRKYNRMMDSNDEKKMVESVLEFRSKNEFMLISKHKFIPIDSDIQTLGGFIYLLLANEFIKVESETLKDPFILSEYLFRACLSLSTYSDMNDQDFLKLWECVDQYYWKPLKRSAKNESIFYSIKIAILNDHIPFSVLSAYINILAYLWHPNSATTHCHAPVIDLKTPFSVFLPIHLQADCELLQKYFEKYVFPSSLKNIYASFTLSSERSLINFPLTPFFNQLKINSSNLKKTVEKLLKGKNSTLKLIGLELYLTFYSLAPDPTFLFYEVFFDFYSIFSEMKSKQQKFAIIQSLKANTDNFPEAISLIEKLLPYPFITSHQNQWIDFLLETNTQYSLDILYKGFIKNKSLFLNCESKTLIKFFQNLLPINYQQAIHVFHWLMSHQQINPNKVLIEQLIHLLIYYENLSSSLKTQFQPYVIRNLNSFFDVDQELIKFKENHPTKFSKSLFGFLTHLFNHAFYETDGDYFLLESCRRNYLTRVHRQSLWIKRINQVIQQSRTQYGAILYLLSVQNKWILPEKFIKTNQTTIGLNLVKALMKENQSPFAKTLLEFLIEKSDIKQFSSITEAIFRSFIQNKSIKFNKENKEILFFLLQTIPMDAQKNASSLLLQSFKDTINLIELNEINSETTSALISLDHLFEQAELIHYIKLLPVEWRDFLLDYLKLTTKIATKERENQLWNIFEEALRLFKRNNKYNRFKLFDQLENLLTFSTPSKNILDWIVNNLEMIFKEVEKKQKINSLKILIKFCHQQGLNLKNYEPYVWKVCINDDQLKISDNEIYSAFQSLDPFSTINCIQIEHYRIFFHVIHHLIIKNSEKPLCLTLWMNCLINLYETKKELLSNESLKNLLLMHSKHLIQNKLYQNTISVLIKVVSKENEKEMNLLWNCVKKYVLNNSKEDLFLFFINQEIEFIKKFEFPLTITNQITEKFWKSSQLSFNEWLFLISLIESSTPKKLTLLASWWQKLNSLPVNDNFHKLIEKSNHFFPKIEHTDDPLLFLQCKYNLISCYKKINHPTIINFLNETDYLYYPFQNNQLFEIKEKICSLLLDGAISFITNQDNDHIFNSIFIHQKKFSEELFKHNLIARNQWNQKFNYKILNSLERSYSIQDQINCCFIIKLMISTIQQEGLPDPVFLKFLKKKMQIFMDSNDSIEKTNSKYPQIYEDIISFSKWICTHPKISMGFINEVLISISNTSQDSVILSEVFYTFLFSTKTSYDLTFIRQNFFHTAFVALGLKDVDLVNSYSHLINLFEEKQKNLNDNESILKGKYHFFLFDHYFNQKIKTIINHEDALESVDVFAKHAPFILIEPKLFDKCLQNTLFFAKTYHNKNFQFLMETNQQNFNVFIYKLLLIKSLLINYPVNKFQKIIFKTIDKDKDLSELLNNFLHEYIHQLFINHETFPQKNFIANFLHTITFLYPPYFKIINLQENQNLVEDIEKDFLLKHWIGFNKIISNAETLNIFENEKNKLSQIKIWISLNNEPFYNMKSEDIIYVIHQFCSFKSYECTQNAVNNLIIFLTLIKLAKALEPTSHKRISESLANLYQKVIKNILNIENEQNKISMFSQLVKETFKFEDNNSLTSHFGTLFYPYIKNMIISLPKDIKNKSLTKCLLTYINIIYKESSVDLLKNGNNLLIEKINFILPYVRKNLVQDTVHCKKSENTSSSLNNLVERIAILLTEPSITHPKLNIPINRSKRELLFTLLESICQQFPGDLLNRKCAILIHLFTHILVNCKDFFFWFDTSNSKKNEKIKKNMLNMVNELGTPLEKKILKSLFIHYQSNLEDRIKNIHYLQETLNFNPNDFTLDESLKIFEFLFFSFTMWKPQDSKKRFFFLIENPVLEQQQLFENSLHTLKLIIENSSNNNSLEFLKEFIMQSFETQWLTPNRGLCTEFVIWARTKIDSINTGEPIYKLLCLVFDFEIHLMIGNEMDDFWIERVKYFKELFNPLRELVVKEKKLSLSWILVHLICKSTTKNTRKIFFNKWLEYLTEIQPPSDLLELHIKDITQYCNNFPKIQKNNFLNEYDKFNNLLFDLSTFLKDFSLDIIKESDSEIIE